MKDHRCHACGVGKIVMLAKAGRHTFYGGEEIEVPDNLEIPTCDNCGSEWMDEEIAQVIDDSLNLNRWVISPDSFEKLSGSSFSDTMPTQQLVDLLQGKSKK